MLDRDDNFCVFNNCFECNKREICSQKGVLVVEFDDEVESDDIDGNNGNVGNGDENSFDVTLSSIIVFLAEHLILNATWGRYFSKGRGFSGC